MNAEKPVSRESLEHYQGKDVDFMDTEANREHAIAGGFGHVHLVLNGRLVVLANDPRSPYAMGPFIVDAEDVKIKK